MSWSQIDTCQKESTIIINMDGLLNDSWSQVDTCEKEKRNTLTRMPY